MFSFHRLRPALVLLASVAGLAAAPAKAQEEAVPSRTINLTVYGADGCPVAGPDEIVVCSRRPESERYRIPRRFRGGRSDRPPELAWGTRAMDLDDAQRDTRPNSCSVNGSWGQSGCTQQLIRQWYAERRQAQAQRDTERGY